MKKNLTVLLLLLFFSFITSVASQNELKKEELALEELKVSPMLLIDTYYAHSSINHFDRQRTYGTQIRNDREFSLNHALIQFSKETNLLRYNLGFHTGTYVQSNYAYEPKDLQYIYTANAGIPIFKNLWFDVGIFESHIGGESAISVKNLTYTRSLIAENSPYYESGARLQYQPNEKILVGIYALNGWQRIKDNNKDKAFGLEIVYNLNDDWKLVYSGFAGNEAPDSEKRQTRYFNNFYIKGKISKKIFVYLAYDLGFQKKSEPSWTERLENLETIASTTPKNSFYRWQGFTLQFAYQPHPFYRFNLRGEGYFDKNQVIVQTNTKDGYQVYAGSVGLDYLPNSNTFIRFEVKHLSNINPIYKTEEEEYKSEETVGIFNFSFLL